MNRKRKSDEFNEGVSYKRLCVDADDISEEELVIRLKLEAYDYWVEGGDTVCKYIYDLCELFLQYRISSDFFCRAFITSDYPFKENWILHFARYTADELAGMFAAATPL